MLHSGSCRDSAEKPKRPLKQSASAKSGPADCCSDNLDSVDLSFLQAELGALPHKH